MDGRASACRRHWGNILLSWVLLFTGSQRPALVADGIHNVRIFQKQVSVYSSQLQPVKENLLKHIEVSPKPVAVRA